MQERLPRRRSTASRAAVKGTADLKAVVFGGPGYIGRHLEQLTKAFDDVVVVARSQVIRLLRVRGEVMRIVGHVAAAEPVPIGPVRRVACTAHSA